MLDRTGGYDPMDAADESAGGALRSALRRARVEAAERADVVVDMRAAELARLELLKEELEPIFAQVPRDVDLFDLGLSQGERPRLFLDMVTFVEMARDKRTYRLMRDGRHGRAVAAESADAEPIVDAVTAYVARRLVERERLLADDDRLSPAAAPVAMGPRLIASETPAPATEAPSDPAAAPAGAARDMPKPAGTKAGATVVHEKRKSGWLRALTILIAFAVGGALGAVVVVGLIIAAARGYIPL